MLGVELKQCQFVNLKKSAVIMNVLIGSWHPVAVGRYDGVLEWANLAKYLGHARSLRRRTAAERLPQTHKMLRRHRWPR